MLRSWISTGGVVLSCLLASCGGSSGGPGDGESGALDGVWDITSSNTGGAAEMTIQGGTVTGFIASSDEGKVVYQPDCIATKDRTEFTITASGNAITGTRSNVHQSTGSSCPSWWNESSVKTFSGVRTRTAPPTQTELDGDWTVNGEASTWTATVNGLTVTAQGKVGVNTPKEAPATLTVSVAEGVVTVASSDKTLAFAARKRP